MEAPSPRLKQLISSALIGGAETSLNELIEILDLKNQGMVLDQLQRIKEFLENWNFVLIPQMTTGDFETARLIKSNHSPKYTEESVLLEIQKGESSHIEFKSSILFDHKRALEVPATNLKELRSEAVLHSALKTIAAFLNCGGGILILGVSNAGEILGLKHDCFILGCNQFDADKWELELRNHITGKFKDGNASNDYVSIDFVQASGVFIARIQIQARKRLTFLKPEKQDKSEKSYKLYRRQGNRTVEVLIDEIEEFLENRNLKE
jgi:hypothetical protein